LEHEIKVSHGMAELMPVVMFVQFCWAIVITWSLGLVATVAYLLITET